MKMCHSHAPCWTRPWNEHLTCDAAFTSGCCQPGRLSHWSSFQGGSDRSLPGTHNKQGLPPPSDINQGQYEKHMSTALHSRRAFSQWYHNLNSHHIKQLRRPVLTALMQISKGARQWVVETPGLFWAKLILRCQMDKKKNILLIEHSYYKRARGQNDVLNETTSQ